MKKVSVIIPTYNNPKQMVRSVESVFNQSYQEIEIIIIDDGSSVDYKHYIQVLKDKSPFPLSYYKKENEGPGMARQFGIEKSSGEFFQYLDSDDELLPNKLEFQVQVLNSDPNLVMTYGLSMVNNDETKIHRKKVKRNIDDDLLKEVLHIRKWHTSSSLWNYKKSEKPYWEKLYNGEDVLHDFNVALYHKKKIKFTNKILVNINIDHGETQLSSIGRNIEYHKRLISDILFLNSEMYKRLSVRNQLKYKKYREPLAERMFHAAMRISIMDRREDSLKMINLSKKTTKSLFKKFELYCLEKIVTSKLKTKHKIYHRYFKFRRKVLSPELHSFRNI